jgi:arylsulfatase A-like enzyme
MLIVVDCLRADRCPPDGGGPGRVCWPALAGNGTVLTQMISTASTTPVCFASILTGQYPFVHGVRFEMGGSALSPAMPSLPGLLRQAGYTTYARFTGPLVRGLGLDSGFDDYQHRTATDVRSETDRPETIYTEWGARLIADLKSGSFAEPWFCMLHLFEVHTPRQLNGAARPGDPGECYDLAWTKLDEKLGEMTGALPANTVTVLTADHGECYRRRADRTPIGRAGRKLRRALGRQVSHTDRRGHGFHVFDELVRIPCCFRGPGVPKGAVVDAQTRQVDIMPTILDICGCEIPQPLHGVSLLGAIRGQAAADLPAYVVSGYDRPDRNWHGLRASGWKYAEHPRSCPVTDQCPMLFDLGDDPDERHNVAGGRPDVVVDMRRQIDDLLHGRADVRAGRAMSDDERAELQDQLRGLGYI